MRIASLITVLGVAIVGTVAANNQTSPNESVGENPHLGLIAELLKGQITDPMWVSARIEEVTAGQVTGYANIEQIASPFEPRAVYVFKPLGIKVQNSQDRPFYEYYSVAVFDGDSWIYRQDAAGYPDDIFKHPEAEISYNEPSSIAGKDWLTGKLYQSWEQRFLRNNNVGLIDYLRRAPSDLTVERKSDDGGTQSIVFTVKENPEQYESIWLSDEPGFPLIRHVVSGVDDQGRKWKWDTKVTRFVKMEGGFRIPGKMSHEEIEDGKIQRKYTFEVISARMLRKQSMAEITKSIKLNPRYNVLDKRHNIRFKSEGEPKHPL